MENGLNIIRLDNFQFEGLDFVIMIAISKIMEDAKYVDLSKMWENI